MIWVESTEDIPELDIDVIIELNSKKYVVREVGYGRYLFSNGIVYRYRLSEV